jgi:hypothetical protein
MFSGRWPGRAKAFAMAIGAAANASQVLAGDSS